MTVNGTLDLNGNSITINGLSGSGTVTSGVAGSVTLTVGANDQTSTFWGVVQNGSGTVGLTKIGSGTLTLATNQTYSGPTTVEAGTLNVLGNLNSDVTLAGGVSNRPGLLRSQPGGGCARGVGDVGRHGAHQPAT